MIHEELPLTPGAVVLEPFNSQWQQLASAEADQIAGSLPGEVLEAHHIGSTAIPGIKAKPIINFILVVRDLNSLDVHAYRLERLGYAPRGEHGIPGRRYLTKTTNGLRSYHLHAFQAGDPQVQRHILFRDYLRANSESAQEYNRLKEELARRFPNDRGAYTEGKTGFIQGIDEKAKLWAARRACQN
jgi:GrpB-like predicted nucleotidyltransferase (UPF0157 family)